MGVYYEKGEGISAQCSGVCGDESFVNMWGGGVILEMTMKSKIRL